VASVDGRAPVVPAVHDSDHRVGLLVMARVPGRSLHDRLGPSATGALGACEALGAALAAMHDHVEVRLPGHHLADDVSEVHRCLPAVRAVAPAIAERLAELLHKAEARAAAESERARLGPAHGALRTDQVLMTIDGPALVDLDSASLAPAERDLANLGAYLWWRSIRRPTEAGALHALADAARHGWAAAAGALPLDAACLRTWRALSLLKIAGRRYRNLTPAEWPLVPDLLDEAARCL